MAKIAQPKAPTTKQAAPTPATPTSAQTEQPAPDISILVGKLEPLFAARVDGENALNNNSLSIIIAVREFREENPTLDRNDCRLAIQTAVAAKYGLKLAAVQNDKKPGEKGYSAYTLVSALLSAAWPKGEAEEKRVQKALAQGKGYVEVRRAASKPQANGGGGGGNPRLITPENFATKLATFLTQAQVDIPNKTMPDILDMADAAIRAIRTSPAAQPAS